MSTITVNALRLAVLDVESELAHESADTDHKELRAEITHRRYNLTALNSLLRDAEEPGADLTSLIRRFSATI